jgi:hypothetical protein
MSKFWKDDTPDAFGPYELTQAIRGKIFVLIDCLLTENFMTLPLDNLEATVKFFLYFLQFTVDYLKKFKSYIPEVHDLCQSKA